MRLLIPLGILIVAGAAWWALQPGPAPDRPAKRATAPKTTPPATPATAAPETIARPQPKLRVPPPLPALEPEPPDMSAAASQKIEQDLEREMAMARAAAIRSTVAMKAPDTAGPTMKAEAVKHAIEQAKPGIVDCYEQALKQDPEAEGRLVVEFTIRAEGGVGTLQDAEVVEDDPGSPFLGMCALGAIAKVRFETEEDGIVKVKYPFVLKPEEE